MKIAFFYNISTGGAKRTVYEQIKYLSAKHDVYVFLLSCQKDNPWDVTLYAKGISRVKFEIKSDKASFLDRLVRDFKVFFILPLAHRRLAREINKGGFDIAVVHMDELTEAPFILRYLKVPFVYFSQEPLRLVWEKDLHPLPSVSLPKLIYEKLTRLIRKKIDLKNFSFAKNVLTNSFFTRGNISRIYGKEAEVCYPGVDNNLFYPRKLIKEKQILFVGGRNFIKGYDFALELENILAKDGFSFKFLDASSTFEDDSNLSLEYSKSFLTLCLSRNEPFGLSAVESMACGTPVLAVDEGGFRETVVNGKTGFLLPREAKLFAEKIKFLWERGDIYEKMRKEAVKRVKASFLWEHHNRILEEKIYSVASRGDILISGQDSGGFGGAETFAFRLGGALSKRGFDVAYTNVSGSSFDNFLKKKKVKVFNIPFRMDLVGDWRGFIKFFVFLPIALFFNIRLINSFFKKSSGFLVLTSFSDKIILTLLGRFFGIKAVWWEYGPFGPLEKRLFGIPVKIYSFVSKYADLVVFPTKNTADKILPFIRNKNTKVISLGIEILPEEKIEAYKRRSVALKQKMGIDKTFNIGILSRIQKEKGHSLLIEAMPLLKKKIPNVRLLIFGEGGDQKDLEKLAQRLGVKKDVLFLGFWEDSYQALSLLDVFAFPTYWEMEGFGLVILEAGNLGLPVVASNFGPVPEVLGKSGVLADVDKDKIAAAVYNLYRNKKKASRLGRSLRERVMAKFDINFCADNFVEALNQLI